MKNQIFLEIYATLPKQESTDQHQWPHTVSKENESDGILVHSGCCNKSPQTGWLKNNRNLFLSVLESGKTKVEAPADSVSGEDLLPSS